VARSVLITGASSGIGAAAARDLASAGFRVFGTSRDPQRLGPDAPAAHWIAMDVRDEASVEAGVAEVIAACGQLDAVVCNAGFGIFGSVEETSLAQARAQFDTNVFGMLATLRAVLPHLRERRSGRIVLVGSLAGRAPIPFQAHYSATKAATDALALALYNELRPHGVHVSLVEPGDIDTPFNDATDFEVARNSVYGESIARCRRVIEEALPKAPGPERVARAIRRALTARRPRIRYPVGPDALPIVLARRLLPDRLSMWLLGRYFRV
jgi:NAD(P)-dependent dehydrogenase (short-subunit alcohol dehydrogenase family)